jgi:hygromycin-B 7''-O-kinase
VTLPPPPISSDEEYAALLGSTEFWEPYARAALRKAGMEQPHQLQVHVAGTYPTLVTDAGLVVKLFGERWFGPDSHRVEREALEVLAGSDLPVPELLAEGELYPDASWTWPYFILSRAEGVPYSELERHLDAHDATQLAVDLATALEAVHQRPLLPRGSRLAPDWQRFRALLERRRHEAVADHRRWGNLPERLCQEMDRFLPEVRDLVDLDRPPVLVHGDLHADHVFVDPESLRVTGLIDFTDAYAGDARYDLVALHFGTFRCRKALLEGFLGAYGWDREQGSWAETMLAFTLLHDFNMFDAFTPTDFTDVGSISELAGRLWDPRLPDLSPNTEYRDR